MVKAVVHVREVECLVREGQGFGVGNRDLEVETETSRARGCALRRADRDVGAEDAGPGGTEKLGVEAGAAAHGEHGCPVQLLRDGDDASPELLAKQPLVQRRRAARTHDLVRVVDRLVEEGRLPTLVVVTAPDEYPGSVFERKFGAASGAVPALSATFYRGVAERTDGEIKQRHRGSLPFR